MSPPKLVALAGRAPVEDEEDLWTVDRAAAYLGMSASWVYRSSEAGKLPCRRIANRVRFVPSELRAWALSQRG